MKLTVYCATFDHDCGETDVRAFATGKERGDAIREWMSHQWEGAGPYVEGPMPDSWQDAWDEVSGYSLDRLAVSEQEIEIDNTRAWHAIKSSVPGGFGVLYDRDEILTMIDGWGEDYEFDMDDQEDRLAINAWLLERGPELEDAMSKIVGDAAPTREEAYRILAERRAADNVEVDVYRHDDGTLDSFIQVMMEQTPDIDWDKHDTDLLFGFAFAGREVWTDTGAEAVFLSVAAHLRSKEA